MKQKNLTPRDRIKHDATRIERKWLSGSRRNLKVEKLGDKLLKESTMLFLENIDVELSAKGTSLIEEASSIGNYDYAEAGNLGTGDQGGAEGNSAMYKPLSLALARRVFPSLFAHKLVGVQPMAAPVGTAFAMRNKYVNPEYNGSNDYFGDTAAWDAIPEHVGFSGGYATAAAGPFEVLVPAVSATKLWYTSGLTIAEGASAGNNDIVLTGDGLLVGTPVTVITVGLAGAVATAGELELIAGIQAQYDAIIAAVETTYASIGAAGTQSSDGKGAEALGRGLSTQNAEFLGIRNGQGDADAQGSSGRFNEVGIEFSKKLIEAVSRQLGASKPRVVGNQRQPSPPLFVCPPNIPITMPQMLRRRAKHQQRAPATLWPNRHV